jgi:hypothetical protein
MMIGGGGRSCERADHGIGITEERDAKFGISKGCDFGNETTEQGSCSTPQYALNLWIR